MVVNCADAAVVAFVDHMNAVVDDYIQSHPEDFPKADKVFIDERTNRPYTAPQQRVEVAAVEIRPRGRKVPPLSDEKRRRRNQNEM